MRKLVIMMFSIVMTITMNLTVFAGGWYSDDVGWQWMNDDGSYPVNEWKWIDGNNDGLAERYYFGTDGYLLTNTWTPDGCIVNEDGAWISNGEIRTEKVNNLKSRKNSIEIFGNYVVKNSVGGVSPIIRWRNGTGKTIKYIYFDMIPYNAVGDIEICSIRGYSLYTGYIVGPIETEPEIGLWYAPTYVQSVMDTCMVFTDESGRQYTYMPITSSKKTYLTQEQFNDTYSQDDSWSCAWYNGDISSFIITGIRVEYMDGTFEEINPSGAMHWQ